MSDITLSDALLTIQKLQEQLDQTSAELARRDTLIESQRRIIERQRKELEKLLERYVLRQKIEMSNVDQPVFAELADYFDNLLKDSDAVIADEAADAGDLEDSDKPESAKRKKSYTKKHPGRQILPAHLERRTTLVDIAEDEKRVLLTKDSDFVNSFLLKRRPFKLLLISTGNINNKDLEGLIVGNIDVIIEVFSEYNFIELNRSQLIYPRLTEFASNANVISGRDLA